MDKIYVLILNNDMGHPEDYQEVVVAASQDKELLEQAAKVYLKMEQYEYFDDFFIKELDVLHNRYALDLLVRELAQQAYKEVLQEFGMEDKGETGE